DYTTIQGALTAAIATDTILVQPGTYTENIIWPETNGIKLISAGDSSNTIIDGGGVSSVIYMNPQIVEIDSTTIIKGFNLTNGSGTNGGGIFIAGSYDSMTQLKLTNMRFSNNTVTNVGGAIYNYYSKLIIVKCSFDNNSVSSNSSGQDYGGGAIYSKYRAPDIYNSIFKSNSAKNGGALRVVYATNNGGGNTKIINSVFENNFSDYGDGGAIMLDNAEAYIYGTSFKGNSGARRGAGIYMLQANNSVIENSIFYNNNCADNGETYGGAIYIQNSGNLINNIFVNNTSANGGAVCSEYAWNDIDNCVFQNNYASDKGGAIYYEDIPGWSPTVSNTSFVNNKAGSNNDSNVGDAIHIESGSTSTFQNSNFFHNGNAIINNNPVYYTSALNNWWGSTNGPYNPISNSGGDGDSTNIYVSVDPWLTTPNTDAPPITAQNTIVTGTGNDFISLKWDASEIGDLAGYKLYYDSDSSGYPYANSVDVGTDTSYTLLNLSFSTTYYLAVTTYDTDGNESWYSNEVNGTTRVIQAQSLDIVGDEDLQHLITHTPVITFGYYDSMNETQTSYQVQVSTQSDYSSADMWDTDEITSSDTSVTYAGSTLEDGVTYYLRAKVGSGVFYSDWSTLTFRMNSTISMEDLNFDPDLGETSVYTEGFPTVSSSPGDAEWDSVFVYYMLSDNAGFSPLVDSALVYFDEATGMADVTWQPTVDPLDNQQYWIKAKGYDGYEYGNESNTYSFMINSENDAPASFSTIYPVDSSEVSSTLPTLIWNISSDPDPLDTVRYMVQFGSTIPDLETFDTDTVTSYQ
ncbi:MAG: hypothetical protein HN994_05320, partial [Candidatus Marinimicrobia bacterium]|nr:hypothetical protein [Candidatus Neomarinimicrobiota bacterium]